MIPLGIAATEEEHALQMLIYEVGIWIFQQQMCHYGIRWFSWELLQD